MRLSACITDDDAHYTRPSILCHTKRLSQFPFPARIQFRPARATARSLEAMGQRVSRKICRWERRLYLLVVSVHFGVHRGNRCPLVNHLELSMASSRLPIYDTVPSQ
jgi:hypothetical protein